MLCAIAAGVSVGRTSSPLVLSQPVRPSTALDAGPSTSGSQHSAASSVTSSFITPRNSRLRRSLRGTEARVAGLSRASDVGGRLHDDSIRPTTKLINDFSGLCLTLASVICTKVVFSISLNHISLNNISSSVILLRMRLMFGLGIKRMGPTGSRTHDLVIASLTSSPLHYQTRRGPEVL